MTDSAAQHCRFLIGIDDTDDLLSRGTGFHTRALGRRLEATGVAVPGGITRHQLLVDPRIRYTSHNSAACLTVRARPDAEAALAAACREFLVAESAAGADAGLCIIPFDAADAGIQAFGQRAKRAVLERGDAEQLAGRAVLEGLTGDGGGVIGALAAVGLRASGSDGRFLWLPGLREATDQRFRVADLAAATGIERVQTVDGTPIERDEALVDLGPWPRAVLIGGRAVLLVERASHGEPDSWQAAPKELVKRY
ncbi:MAG TPA: hypothetical protein VKP10_01970 [Gemmatimonadales bacterium]|nr:hypothetical protein [Gemmatimonadales bacterium]